MRSPITRTLSSRLAAPVPSMTRAPTIRTPRVDALGAGVAAGFPQLEASVRTASETTRADRFIESRGSSDTSGKKNVARGPALQEARHPLSHVVADDGDAEPDDEHVEPRTEHATPREDRARRADQKVRCHGERERRDHRGGAGENEERKDRYERADRGGEPGEPRLTHGRGVRVADLELLLHLLLEHALRIGHDLGRERVRRVAMHAFR